MIVYCIFFSLKGWYETEAPNKKWSMNVLIHVAANIKNKLKLFNKAHIV